MIMIAGVEDVQKQLFDPSDYELKLNIFQRYQPEDNTWWHDRFLDSRQWLAMRPEVNHSPEKDGLFFENIWQDSHLTTREFYDRFWRDIACEVSFRDLGMVMKTHRYLDVAGLKNLLPQSKVTTCVAYQRWKEQCIRLKKTPGSVLRAYNENDELPEDYPAFRFHIDDMMQDPTIFEAQMQVAYKHLGFEDFKDAKPVLMSLRKVYMGWHIIWNRKTRI